MYTLGNQLQLKIFLTLPSYMINEKVLPEPCNIELKLYKQNQFILLHYKKKTTEDLPIEDRPIEDNQLIEDNLLPEHARICIPFALRPTDRDYELIPLEKLAPKELKGEPRADLDSLSVMAPWEIGIRSKVKGESTKPSLILFLLIIVTGAFWLVYLFYARIHISSTAYSGQTWANTINFLIWIVFLYAEIINFILGIIYTFNFFATVTRRWKSFHHLPNNHLRPKVHNLIFHLSEAISDTMRTIDGILRMKTCGGQISSTTYLCDDGFFIASKKDPFHFDIKKPYFYKDTRKAILECLQPARNADRYHLIEMDDHANVRSPHPQSTEEDENRAISPALQQYNILIRFIKAFFSQEISELGKKMKREIELKLKNYQVELSNYLASISSDKKFIEDQCINQEFCLKLSEKQWKRLNNMKTLEPEILKEQYNLSMEELKKVTKLCKKLVREDCCRASFSIRYTLFFWENGRKCKQQEIVLVARIKKISTPKKIKSHHAKAGNANNCIYNEVNIVELNYK